MNINRYHRFQHNTSVHQNKHSKTSTGGPHEEERTTNHRYNRIRW